MYKRQGVLWAFAGAMLIRFAGVWLISLSPGLKTAGVSSGLLLALAIYWFGFSKFADKNIQRIRALASKRPCVFAFQQWSSYPLVVVMISLGIYLRKYSPFPKSLLVPIYLGIGGSLLLASIRYLRNIFTPI